MQQQDNTRHPATERPRTAPTRKTRHNHKNPIKKEMQTDADLGARYWALMESGLDPNKNIPIQTAKRIAADLGVELVVLYQFDREIVRKITSLYAPLNKNGLLEAMNMNLGPVFAPDSIPTVWIKTLFPNTVSTALTFRALACYLVQYYHQKNSTEGLQHLYSSIRQKHQSHELESIFKATLWSYAYLHASHHDYLNNTQYKEEVLSHMLKESFESNDTQLFATAHAYVEKAINLLIRNKLTANSSLADILAVHVDSISPLLE